MTLPCLKWFQNQFDGYLTSQKCAVMPKEDYQKIFGEKPLGILVRSIVGLSRKAAKEAFAEFLSKAPLEPDQIAFLNEVIEFLSKWHHGTKGII